MTAEFIRLSTLEFAKVQFYSVRIEGKKHSEFRDFNIRMGQGERNLLELADINRYIKQIGQKYGAQKRFFRDEASAEALPPPSHQFIESDHYGDFGLRLYCIRLCSTIVVLLNGDRKTALTAQNCPNCAPHFRIANKISNQITTAITDGYIHMDIERMRLDIDEDFELVI